ncbi:hypothetical protein CW702_00750 [Candidatus Bathyarchaeota archaeon]|nr:MAG: hypothetical protein CW702_00750 [Candidatus Bathyarchaeota archaeon]
MRLLYNFRGVAGEELTPDLALRIGNLAADILDGDVAVGSDHRTSSPMLKAALTAGLLSKGLEVTDYGVLPTPVLAYLVKEKHGGGAMVTASHNPPEWNGIKFFDADGLVFGPEEENYVRDRIDETLRFEEWRKLASLSINFQGKIFYEERVLEQVNIGSRELRIVVDAGGGVGALLVPDILERMGFNVVKLYCDLDPFFSGRPPEPRPENLNALSSTIREVGADVGFAYDGDCDRVVIYDERGRYVPGNLGMIYLADNFVPDGSKIVVNVTGFFGMRKVFDGRYRLIPEKWGQTFLQKRMKLEGSIFGGEPDGHYMWPGLFQSYADAIFSTVKFVEAMSNTKEKLSEALSKYPPLKLLRVKSEPWDGSFIEMRDDIISFMEKISDSVYTEIDTHLLYAESDMFGLTVRQSHWDKTVRVEVEAMSTLEANRIIHEIYDRLLRPRGIRIPSLQQEK